MRDIKMKGCPFKKEIKMGAKVEEQEHNLGRIMSIKIASDHIKIDPCYYTKEMKGGQ
jgi:hypothetical protein